VTVRGAGDRLQSARVSSLDDKRVTVFGAGDRLQSARVSSLDDETSNDLRRRRPTRALLAAAGRTAPSSDHVSFAMVKTSAGSHWSTCGRPRARVMCREKRARSEGDARRGEGGGGAV
jgi:hypothetical protein